MATSARRHPVLALLTLPPLLAACTSVKSVHYELQPKANECQITEVRASGLSTLVSGICWDAEGRVIGMAGAGGKPAISVPLDVLQSAAYVLGPYLLGQALIKAAGGIKGTVDIKSNQLNDAIEKARDASK